eukprot:gene3256-3534_t
MQASSEWALLNKLEHSIVVEQDAARLAARLQEQQRQRRSLAAQVAEHEVARKAADAVKAADLAAAVSDITAFQAEEAAKAEAAAAVADRLRKDRQRQMAAAQAARTRAADKKAREEAALLTAIIATVKLPRPLCLPPDWDCNRTLQKQDEAHEAALKAFHDSVAARAVQAGAAAVAENRSRQEREDRLVAASEARAQAEAEAKRAAEVAKRAAMAADLKESAAAAAAARAAAQQVAQAAQTRARADIEADLQHFQHAERLTEQHRRERNLDYRRALEQQIAEDEARAVLDDVFMAEKERELNRQLVTHVAGGLAGLDMKR